MSTQHNIGRIGNFIENIKTLSKKNNINTPYWTIYHDNKMMDIYDSRQDEIIQNDKVFLMGIHKWGDKNNVVGK